MWFRKRKKSKLLALARRVAELKSDLWDRTFERSFRKKGEERTRSITARVECRFRGSLPEVWIEEHGYHNNDTIGIPPDVMDALCRWWFKNYDKAEDCAALDGEGDSVAKRDGIAVEGE